MSLTAEWKEWREVAKANEINSRLFQQRISKGKTPEEAATTPLINNKSDLTKEHYQIAKANGISPALAYQRYEIMFWSIEDAITKAPREMDEDYLYWRDIAKKNEISNVTYWRRVKAGYSHQDAATLGKQKPGRKKKTN